MITSHKVMTYGTCPICSRQMVPVRDALKTFTGDLVSGSATFRRSFDLHLTQADPLGARFCPGSNQAVKP